MPAFRQDDEEAARRQQEGGGQEEEEQEEVEDPEVAKARILFEMAGRKKPAKVSR